MARPGARALGRRLRRLDQAGLARFVAALWAETGWETSVEEGRVLLRRRAGDEPRVVEPLSSSRAAVAALVAPPDVDAVVVLDRHLARAIAGRGAVEVLDVAAVHERLNYGVPAERQGRLLGRVPPDRPWASRRAVLSTLALGLGVATAGAPRPGELTRAPTTPGTFDPASRGIPIVAGDASEDDRATRGTGRPGDGEPCFPSPTIAVTRQLETLPEAPTSSDDDAREIDWTAEQRRETTEAFRDALADVDSGPLLAATEVTVRRGEYQPGRVAIRASARTADGTRAIYEFSYADGAPDCATLRGVTLLRRERPD